ncbi:Glycosyl transferase family 2 [Bacteroidales bacterium WCE2004]|nr:glycosyltransferase [Bacteroidales bacterium]SKC38851.1 Glycosyl transferase family 2 [Bacteroidales bacterium WCE2004]
MKISLIIPVYNAEKTLPDTLESIRAQRFRDFEVVFAEDAGTDGSLALLERFCADSGLPCKLLRAERNGGAAAARNRALDAAEGEYLAFADADDLLDPALLERAAGAAQTADGPADIVGWDWTLGRAAQNGRYMRQADYASATEALCNLTGGTMRWNLWMFLVRRELVEAQHLRFIPGADLGEDMQFMLRAFLHAGRVVQLHEALYRYNAVNSASISRQFSPERRAQIETNLAEAGRHFAGSDFLRAHPDALTDLKLFLKRPLLIGGGKKDFETWYGWFPEANARARQRGALPLHTYLLQKMAARRNWAGVVLYNLLVYKFVYGILYR